MSQKLIDDKLQGKENLFNRMEEQKDLILEGLVIFVKQWFKDETTSTIKKEADKVIELGDTKAKGLKLKTQDLIDNSSSLVHKYMNEDSIWWHHNEDNASYHSYEHRLLDSLDKMVRLMLGELGSLLEEYGLINVPPHYSTNYKGSWRKEVDGRIIYGYGVSYSKEVLELGNQYAKLILEGQKINFELQRLKDKLKKENVEQWWDSL
jgi:hypothetical protein